MNFSKHNFNAALLPPESRWAVIKRRFHIWTKHHSLAMMGNRFDGFWYVPRAWRNYFRIRGIRRMVPYVSEHIVVGFDRKRELIYRLSLDKQGNQRILKNARFLRTAHELQRPYLHKLVKRGALYYSAERLIEGGVLRAAALEPDDLDDIIQAVSPLWLGSCTQRPFDPTAAIHHYSQLPLPEGCAPIAHELTKLVKDRLEHWRGQPLIWATIHGDLIHRNIIRQPDGLLVFIDGDRSEILFPEIDIIQLVLFWQIHRQHAQARTWTPFIEATSGLVGTIDPYLEYFYRSCPAFAENRPHLKLFQILHAYRLTMQSAAIFTNEQDHNQAVKILKAGLNTIERI